MTAWLQAWRRPDRLITLLLLLIFGTWYLVGRTYPSDAKRLPVLVGIVGVVLASVQLAIGFIGTRTPAPRAPEAANHAAHPVGTSARRIWVGVLAAPVYSTAVYLLGFHIATFLAMGVLPRCLGYGSWRQLALIALVTVLGVHLVFTTLMSVTLPPGLLGDWVLRRFVYGA